LNRTILRAGSATKLGDRSWNVATALVKSWWTGCFFGYEGGVGFCLHATPQMIIQVDMDIRPKNWFTVQYQLAWSVDSRQPDGAWSLEFFITVNIKAAGLLSTFRSGRLEGQQCRCFPNVQSGPKTTRVISSLQYIDVNVLVVYSPSAVVEEQSFVDDWRQNYAGVQG
jgi:hypothetical protein